MAAWWIAIVVIEIIICLVLVACVFLANRFKWTRHEGKDTLRTWSYVVAAIATILYYTLNLVGILTPPDPTSNCNYYIAYIFADLFSKTADILILGVIIRTIHQSVHEDYRILRPLTVFLLVTIATLSLVCIGLNTGRHVPEATAIAWRIYEAIYVLCAILLTITAAYAVGQQKSRATILMLLVVICLAIHHIFILAAFFSHELVAVASIFIQLFATIAIYLITALVAAFWPANPTQQLCTDCSSLDLTPEKFRGLHQDQADSLPSELRYRHKLKRKIRPNGDCPFCALVHNEVLKAGSSQVNNNTECLIEWVLDDHQAKSAETFSRRIRISWSRPDHDHSLKGQEREELYVIYAPPHDVFRRLPPNAPGSIDQHCKGDIYSWIRECIRLCDQEHQNRIEDPSEEGDRNDSRFRELVAQPWFYVVDVRDMKLTELPVNNQQLEQYVALSYRWAPETTHKTLRLNLKERKQNSGLNVQNMPRTIQHAIELVGRLALEHGSRKLRFIWIDSLCIVQDDPKSLQYNSERMHLIFRNAYFTICAADADPNTGLRAMRSRHTLKERAIKKDLNLLVSRSPESIIQTSDWSTRAWTFQERILSRRCLVFAGNRIYFQCHKLNYDDTGIGWSSDWRKSPLRIIAEVKDRPIRFYMKCVESYTGRNLSFPEDIIKAFDGVSGLIAWYTCAPFFFGLPSSHFDFALLWRPHEGKVRRLGNLDTDTQFPSWSWSGWQREENPNIGTTASYPLDVLEGALINLHRWLLEHTWIIWYIRDEGGDLKALWGGYKPPSPERAQKMLQQWRGYQGYERGRNNTGIDDYGRRARLPHNSLPQPQPQPLPFTRLSERTSRMPILRFFTWKCDFYIARNDDRPGPGKKLVRLDVLNQYGDWCGTVVVDESWAKRHNNQLCEFIALSDARKFTEDECTSWTYPIPENLEDIDWHLFHVMILENIRDLEVYERRGLGKVLMAAFRSSEWKEIILT